MFTIQELNKHIDKKYFNVFDKSAFTVTLQSKNTAHCWHLLNREYKNHTTIIIYHTHHYGSQYHEQCHARTLGQAIDYIKGHDKYQLNIRNVRKQEALWNHKRNRYSSARI